MCLCGTQHLWENGEALPIVVAVTVQEGAEFKGAKTKSRIQETKQLSTDAYSSTVTTVGWTKNTQKPNFFEKRKKSSKTQKPQKRLEICQN